MHDLIENLDILWVMQNYPNSIRPSQGELRNFVRTCVLASSILNNPFPQSQSRWSSVYCLSYLTAMWKVSRLNPASYLCWNMHVGKWLAAMLAIKRSAGVTPEVNLREGISHTPLPSVNKATHSALKPRGDITRSPKQRYQWPNIKGFMSSKIFLKNKQKPPLRSEFLMVNFAETLWGCRDWFVDVYE